MVTYGHPEVPGDLLDDVKAGATNVANEARRAIAVKTVIALAVFYVLASPRRRGRRWA